MKQRPHAGAPFMLMSTTLVSSSMVRVLSPRRDGRRHVGLRQAECQTKNPLFSTNPVEASACGGNCYIDGDYRCRRDDGQPRSSESDGDILPSSESSSAAHR